MNRQSCNLCLTCSFEQDPKVVAEATSELERECKEIVTEEQIKELTSQLKNMQSLIIAKLEKIPDLSNKVEALSQSTSFKDLGNALKLLTEINPARPVKPKKPFSWPSWLKPNHPIKFLDGLAGTLVLSIWLAASGWILQSFGLSWGSAIALAVFWLFFIVAFRVVIGGILD